MPVLPRSVAALFAAVICFSLTSAPSVPATLFDDSVTCLSRTGATDATKLDCINTLDKAVVKDPKLLTKAYAPLVQTCFKDPSFFVRLQAARLVARFRFDRNAIVSQEMTFFLDPAIQGSTECLNEAEAMSLHLQRYEREQKFATMDKEGLVAQVWTALLNGPVEIRKNTLALFAPMLAKGDAKELTPYRDNAEKFFDWLFTPDAAKLGAEDLITVPIDQAASILFSMGDTVFLGKHLLTPIGSWVLYPNDKNPKSVSPDARWGYADDFNAELRPRLPINFKFDPAAAKVWADQLQILVISQTPVKTIRACINRATAVDNLEFAGPEVQVLTKQMLAELASEESKGKLYNQAERGCGEVEARAMFERRAQR